MKKLLIVLGLLVLALFVVSCAPKEAVEGEEVVEEKGALAGEAVKVGGKSVRIQCKQFPVDLQEGMTGYQFCRNKGFDTCEHVTLEIDSAFYSSEDKTCTDGIQTGFTTFKEELCDSELESGNICKSFVNSSEEEDFPVEPLNGDIRIKYVGGIISCCKII